jgi:DNA (cytosine-5)-methyltransferase 1
MAVEIEVVKQCTSRLSAEYGDPLLNNQTDPIEELIFIFLSDRTDEAKYLAAFRRLKSHFRQWEDLLVAATQDIEHTILYAGMGRRRAELLQKMLWAVSEKFGGLTLSSLADMSPEEAEDELLCLPSVGRKGARCVLLYCFNFPVLPVDIHTYRLAIRLGIISRQVSYERSHSILPPLIPECLRRAFHVNAVAHGRIRCFARNPNCAGCPIYDYCSYPKAENSLPIVLRPKPLAIDIFAGAGGLSLGFKQAGFKIVQAIEKDPHAAETYRGNHTDTDLIEDDICKLEPLKCLMRLGLRPGDITVLIAGPPCQGFSESNRRTRSLDNPKNYLYKEFLRFLRVMKPIWFVLENVAGIRTLERGRIMQNIIEACRLLGYKVDWRELNSAQYGVPQFRRRIFIIGNQLGLPIPFPVPTHAPNRKPYVTVWQAISDLPHLKNGASVDYLPYKVNGRHLSQYQRAMRASIDSGTSVQGNLVTLNSQKVLERYRHIRPGCNWKSIPDDLLNNYEDYSRCHTGIYHRLQWRKLSKVIGNFRKNMLIHPEDDRGLSVREAARLQSFPDNYVFYGSIGFQQQQVGDSVPPLLAEAVAHCIRRTSKQSF